MNKIFTAHNARQPIGSGLESSGPMSTEDIKSHLARMFGPGTPPADLDNSDRDSSTRDSSDKGT